jgi:hypothetical protein
MRRPLVVVPLCLAFAAALGVLFARPWEKSADELYAAAKPLLESENPDDWDRAVDQYLDPLARKYPDRYAREVEAARAKVKDRRDLTRALAEGAKVSPGSDAERAYLRGLRLAQAGDPDAARRTWQAVVAAFGGVESESRWVQLARTGLEALGRPENRNHRPPPDRTALDTALARAKALASAGKEAEAAAIFRALEDLFRDEPGLFEIVRQAKDGK